MKPFSLGPPLASSVSRAARAALSFHSSFSLAKESVAASVRPSAAAPPEAGSSGTTARSSRNVPAPPAALRTASTSLAMPTALHYLRLPIPARGRAEFATAAHGTARNLRFRGKFGKQLSRSMDEIRSRSCLPGDRKRAFSRSCLCRMAYSKRASLSRQ